MNAHINLRLYSGIYEESFDSLKVVQSNEFSGGGGRLSSDIARQTSLSNKVKY